MIKELIWGVDRKSREQLQFPDGREAEFVSSEASHLVIVTTKTDTDSFDEVYAQAVREVKLLEQDRDYAEYFALGSRKKIGKKKWVFAYQRYR
jgi:hypothetical protein